MTRDEMKSEVASLLLEQRRLLQFNLTLPPDKLLLLKRLEYRLGLTRSTPMSRRTTVKRYSEVTDENSFHAALDANPEDHITRQVFADWLQDRGDPRAAGYRALGKWSRIPMKQAAPLRYYFGPGHTDMAFNNEHRGEHHLPHDWTDRMVRMRGTSADDHPFESTRREIEDRAALAFGQLPPERQHEILNPTPAKLARVTSRRLPTTPLPTHVTTPPSTPTVDGGRAYLARRMYAKKPKPPTPMEQTLGRPHSMFPSGTPSDLITHAGAALDNPTDDTAIRAFADHLLETHPDDPHAHKFVEWVNGGGWSPNDWINSPYHPRGNHVAMEDVAGEPYLSLHPRYSISGSTPRNVNDTNRPIGRLSKRVDSPRWEFTYPATRREVTIPSTGRAVAASSTTRGVPKLTSTEVAQHLHDVGGVQALALAVIGARHFHPDAPHNRPEGEAQLRPKFSRRRDVRRYAERSYSHEDFVRNIAAEPEDATRSLVYADWLEENGMPTFAGIIRHHVARHNSQQGPHVAIGPPDPQQPFLPHAHGQTHGGTPNTHLVFVTQTMPGNKYGHYYSQIVPNVNDANDLIDRLNAEGIPYTHDADYPIPPRPTPVVPADTVDHNTKLSRRRPIRMAKADTRHEAHPLIAGHALEHSLRHMANDASRSDDVRNLSKRALTTGDTSALWALHDAVQEDGKGVPGDYNLMSAADKIGLDAHTHHALTEVANDSKVGVPPEYHTAFNYTPEHHATVAVRGLERGSTRHNQFLRQDRRLLNRVRQRVGQLAPGTDPKLIDESIRRHAHRAYRLWAERNGGGDHNNFREQALKPLSETSTNDPDHEKIVRATRYKRRHVVRRYSTGPTTEEDFHRILDANPEDHHTRQVFADWLQERDDPRAAGYRALGQLEKYPQCWAEGKKSQHGWTVADNNMAPERHRLPTDWLEQMTGNLPEYAGNKYWRNFGNGRRGAEDAAAHAFSQLPPERQQEILTPQEPHQASRRGVVRRYALRIGAGEPLMGGADFMHEVHDEQGKRVGHLWVTPMEGGTRLHINHVGAMGHESNSLGPAVMRDAIRQLKTHYPNAKKITGTRVSGAVKANTGKELPTSVRMGRRGVVRRYMDGGNYTHADFAHKVAENPHDLTNSLIYADWLAEQGLPHHEEMVRRAVAESQKGHQNRIFTTMAPPQSGNGKETGVALGGDSDRGYHLDVSPQTLDESGQRVIWSLGPLHRNDAHRLITGLAGEGAHLDPVSQQFIVPPHDHNIAKLTRPITTVAPRPHSLPKRYAKVNRSDFMDALHRLQSSNHKALLGAAGDVARRMGVQDSHVLPALHDAPGGSVPGVAQAIYGPMKPEKVHELASWVNGLLPNGPGYSVFHARPTGPDTLYRIRHNGSGMDARVKLDRAGLKERVLIPHRKGFDVLIPDKGNKLAQAVTNYAQNSGLTVEASPGHFSTVGSNDQSQSRSTFRNKVVQGERTQMQRDTPRRYAEPTQPHIEVKSEFQVPVIHKHPMGHYYTMLHAPQRISGGPWHWHPFFRDGNVGKTEEELQEQTPNAVDSLTFHKGREYLDNGKRIDPLLTPQEVHLITGGKEGTAPDQPDWRPQEMLPEDFYAMGRRRDVKRYSSPHAVENGRLTPDQLKIAEQAQRSGDPVDWRVLGDHLQENGFPNTGEVISRAAESDGSDWDSLKIGHGSYTSYGHGDFKHALGWGHGPTRVVTLRLGNSVFHFRHHVPQPEQLSRLTARRKIMTPIQLARTKTTVEELFHRVGRGDHSAIVPLADALRETGREDEAGLLDGSKQSSHVTVVPSYGYVSPYEPSREMSSDGTRFRTTVMPRQEQGMYHKHATEPFDWSESVEGGQDDAWEDWQQRNNFKIETPLGLPTDRTFHVVNLPKSRLKKVPNDRSWKTVTGAAPLNPLNNGIPGH